LLCLHVLVLGLELCIAAAVALLHQLLQAQGDLPGLGDTLTQKRTRGALGCERLMRGLRLGRFLTRKKG
jgi:hypothetical protein